MNLEDFEIIIRRKPITDFESVEDLKRFLARQPKREPAPKLSDDGVTPIAEGDLKTKPSV